MAVKKFHIVTGALIIIGALYVWHMYNTHGTGKSALQGLGINS